MGVILSIWTVVVLVLFVAIALWAWSDRRRKEFDEAAQIPFDEDRGDAPENEELNDG